MCEVGKRIRDRRIELGYSAEELAPMVGLSPATIYRYENGDIKKVSTNKLKPFASALRTTEAYLMGWTDKPENIEPDLDANLSMEFSETAIKIAHAYDSMSEYGKSLIDMIVENENKFKIAKLVPVIEMAHPSKTQAQYNAKQEQKELSEEQNRINQKKI